LRAPALADTITGRVLGAGAPIADSTVTFCATGRWGEAIQGPLNSNQTTTMANFATIADGLSGCIAKVTADACNRLFEAARGPTGAAPLTR
jgi:hypothetical protein